MSNYNLYTIEELNETSLFSKQLPDNMLENSSKNKPKNISKFPKMPNIQDQYKSLEKEESNLYKKLNLFNSQQIEVDGNLDDSLYQTKRAYIRIKPPTVSKLNLLRDACTTW